MKWSVCIGRVFGIDIRVHATFVFIVALGALEFGRVFGVRGTVFGAALICAIFACVTLHELGHSWVALRLGVPVREIVLLPIGGLARLNGEPQTPLHELLIALAGPLVNAVLTAAFAGVAWLIYGLDATVMQAPLDGPSLQALIGWMVWSNAMLAVFNLIPALPMDGGRVFRAGLSLFLGRTLATDIAATVGQALAAGFAAFGVVRGQLLLLLIGVFVFFAATRERAVARMRANLGRFRAAEACDPTATVIEPGERLATAIDRFLRTSQAHFAVVHGQRLVGALSREVAVAAAGHAGLHAYVSRFMRRDVPVVEADATLDEVRALVTRTGGGPVAVMGPEGFVGLLTYEDLTRVSSLTQVMDRSGVERPPLHSQSGAPLL